MPVLPPQDKLGSSKENKVVGRAGLSQLPPPPIGHSAFQNPDMPEHVPLRADVELLAGGQAIGDTAETSRQSLCAGTQPAAGWLRAHPRSTCCAVSQGCRSCIHSWPLMSRKSTKVSFLGRGLRGWPLPLFLLHRVTPLHPRDLHLTSGCPGSTPGLPVQQHFCQLTTVHKHLPLNRLFWGRVLGPAADPTVDTASPSPGTWVQVQLWLPHTVGSSNTHVGGPDGAPGHT